MCNAWNHYPGCTCGFGGEGHLGGGWGGGRSSTFGFAPEASPAIYYSYGTSLSDLASELGYSVVFPTICRYCGDLIYLFASPDGGFAIFDSLGAPWPKHDCWGITPDISDYTSLSVECSPKYQLPIPDDAPITERVGTSAKGVVVSKTQQSGPFFAAEYYLYDGTQLIKVWSAADLEIGNFVEGSVEVRCGHCILNNPKNLLPGKPPTPARAPAKGKLAATRAVDVASAWSLQFDAHHLKKSEPSASALLQAALEALLSGYPLVASLVLAELVLLVSNAVTKEMKARHLKTLLLLLQEMNLHWVVPELARSLSRGTREALDAATSQLLERLAKLGELKKRTESGTYVLNVFQNRWKKEARYAAAFETKFGLKLSAMTARFKGEKGGRVRD